MAKESQLLKELPLVQKNGILVRGRKSVTRGRFWVEGLHERRVAERLHQRAEFYPAYSAVSLVLQVGETTQSDGVSSSVLQHLPVKKGRWLMLSRARS